VAGIDSFAARKNFCLQCQFTDQPPYPAWEALSVFRRLVRGSRPGRDHGLVSTGRECPETTFDKCSVHVGVFQDTLGIERGWPCSGGSRALLVTIIG
jgi:hypothetical protein